MDPDDASLELLELNRIPEYLASTLWKDGYFSDESELSPDYESHIDSLNISDIFQNLSTHIFQGLKTGSVKGWPDLINQGFDFKRFLLLIHHLLCTAIANPEDEHHRTNGLWATRLYFSFLATPCGSPFLIYHPNLYSKALKTLQFVTLLKRQEPQHKQDRYSRGRGSLKSSEEEEFHEANTVRLSKHELQYLQRMTISAEIELISALQTGDFSREADAAALTVEALSRVAMQETLERDLLAERVSESSTFCHRSIPLNAFYCLVTLCSERHGKVEEIVCLIMRYAYDAMVMGFQKNTKNQIPGRFATVREVYMDFICHVCRTAGENARIGLLTLLQYLCLYPPDRAELRSKLVENVVCLIFKLPHNFLLKSSVLIMAMSCHTRASVRLFSTEILGRMLTSLQVDIVDNKPQEFEYNLLRTLFAAVLARIQDASAIVRSKAMLRFTCCLQDSSDSVISKHLLSEIFIQPYLHCTNLSEVKQTDFGNFNTVTKQLQENPRFPVPSPCARAILSELIYFSNDDKALVRKGALQSLLKLLSLNVKFMEINILAEISSHCQDESVLVRKMMVQEFTDLLLTYPSHQQLMRQWTINALPLIIDSEKTVAEKALENLARAFWENMAVNTQMQKPENHLPWMLMDCISQLQQRNIFLKACSMWKAEALRPYLRIVKSHIGMGKPYNDSAWVTLMCLAEHMTIPFPEFICDFYHNEIHEVPNVSMYISKLVMEVLWLTWKQLPTPDKDILSNELNTDLLLFKVPVPLISRAVDIRHGIYLSKKKSNDKDYEADWAVCLIKKCEESIFESLRLNHEKVQDEEAMKRFIITLGNVCLYCPKIVRTRTTDQLIEMLCPSQNCVSDLWRGSSGTEVKAGLVVTLGKIGLQSEKLAVKLIEILGPLLAVTRESDLKNNIMICLTDLCVRYTSLSDDLLPDIYVCLKDNQQSVRESTLKLLIYLLQEDYIKIRDNLIFHLLSMLNDEDHSIVTLTRCFFIHSLLQKKSNCFTSSFIPCIFHYNGYEGHRGLHKTCLTAREKEVFDISGPRNKEKRRDIYRFMLSHSDDDNRFRISGRLCIEICNEVLEDKIGLDVIGEEVLRDCLYVMDCDEIRITDNKELEDDDEPADHEEISELIINISNKKIISELVKKRIIDTEIPTLSKLRKKLLSLNSALTADVVRVLHSMIREHKIDAEEVLRNDPQLLREIKRSDYRREANSSIVSREETSSEGEE